MPNSERKPNTLFISAVKGVSPDKKTLTLEDTQYDMSAEADLVGFGRPMTLDYLQDRVFAHLEKINKQYEDARKNNDDAQADAALDENIAITLGKESLLLLLSQPGCDGVRFYFCKNPADANSVVAVGVTNAIKDGQIVKSSGEINYVKDPSIPRDLYAKGNSFSILQGAEKENGDVTPLNFEVGPPYTFRQLKTPNVPGTRQSDQFTSSVEKAFDDYLNTKTINP